MPASVNVEARFFSSPHEHPRQGGARHVSEFWPRQFPDAIVAPAMNSQLTIASATQMAIIG